MAVLNLYTQSQVETTLIRALKCLFIVSSYIETGFWYFASTEYTNIKDQQYDIYILYNAISQQQPFIDYSAENDTFNQLVGWLISKLSQYDTFGQFGNNFTNPYYQGNSGISVEATLSSTPTFLNFTDADLLDAGGGNWYLPINLPSGVTVVNVMDNGVTLVGWEYDTTFNPDRIYGFANNDAPQTITVIGLGGVSAGGATLILTTDGSSGPSTLDGNTLNIPDYSGSTPTGLPYTLPFTLTS